MPSYTCKSARSVGLVLGIGIVIVVETFALHALTVGNHPFVAWAMTLSSLSVLAWLVADYRAMGAAGIITSPEGIDIRIGRRISLFVSRDQVASAIRPSFRDLPQPGLLVGKEYINLTKHVSPNVLLTLREPVTVSIGGFIRQPARLISFRLDDPDAFLADLRT